MKLVCTLLVALILPYTINSYTKHSAQQALSECSRCLENPQNRYCTDGTDYYCCDIAENSALCNPTTNAKSEESSKIQGNATQISCSHTRYKEGLKKYQICPQDRKQCMNTETRVLSKSVIPMASKLDDRIQLSGLPAGQMCTYRIEVQDNLDSS